MADATKIVVLYSIWESLIPKVEVAGSIPVSRSLLANLLVGATILESSSAPDGCASARGRRVTLRGDKGVALYANDLDDMTCLVPGCQCDGRTLYIHSRCHPQAPTWARYTHGTAALVVECTKCGEAVAEFALSVKETYGPRSRAAAQGV